MRHSDNIVDDAGGGQKSHPRLFFKQATGLLIWNEFLIPLIILGPSQGATITTGIYSAIGQYTIDHGQIFALMFLSSLPMLLFFFAMQKEFISGLTSGALKG
jgi:raffinose/stachyose/melibiose transport system permease protein